MATTARISAQSADQGDSLDRYLGEISREPLLSDDEERRLATLARRGDEEAERELVARNLRFVVTIAKRYQHRGLALDDLIAEGNLGLLAAAHRFDPAQGVRFITYAVWWIRQAILVALTKQVRLVRIPASRLARNARLSRVRNLLRSQLGHEPSPEEIAREAQVDTEAVEDWRSVQNVQLSLDSAPNDITERVLGEQIAVEPDDDPIEDDLTSKVVADALASLQPREATIVRRYFGLDGNSSQTLDDIAAAMSITRERVRQIRDRAIGKLRYGKHAASLFALTR